MTEHLSDLIDISSLETSRERFLTQQELADRWQFKTRTIEGWRRRGVGPVYVRIERRVRYRLTDIKAYEDAGQVGLLPGRHAALRP